MLHTQRIKNRLREARGFTIVELAVVILVIGVIFPVFSMLIIGSYKDTVFLDDTVKMNTEVKQALWYMDDSVRTANSFSAVVPVEYNDPYGAQNLGSSGANAWSYKGSAASNRVLITKNYATTVNPLNTGRQPVFRNTSEFNCATQMYYQPQLQYVTIYFVNNQTLYKRILTDTVSPLCPGNVQQQKQTCPPYVAMGIRDVSCLANDEILATKVTNFSVQYFSVSQDGSSTQIDPSYTSTNAAVLSPADYVLVSITTATRNGAVTSTLTQRMTKVNQL